MQFTATGEDGEQVFNRRIETEIGMTEDAVVGR